jgi:hypothetical protein
MAPSLGNPSPQGSFWALRRCNWRAAHGSTPRPGGISPRGPVCSPVLARLFPEGAACVELRAPGDVSQLFPTEETHIQAAVAKRRAEFAAGRVCARSALAELGAPLAPLGVRPDRSPDWPAGLTGSITHTQGFCGAVAHPHARVLRRRGWLARTLPRHWCGRGERGVGYDGSLAGYLHPGRA